MTKHWTLEDYEPYVGKSGQSNEGLQPLPNARDVDPLQFLNDMAAFGHMWKPVWGYAVVGDPTVPSKHDRGGFLRKQWTQFFLTSAPNMGGGLGGGGYAVTYGPDTWTNGESGRPVRHCHPIVRSFAICEHAFAEGPGANHARGWHPGKCSKCGMDMSIDSGD